MKYSPGGTYPINVGMNGHIDIGRGSNIPQIITCRVEEVRCESLPRENYIRVSGRCWGEKLFRRVVTKTYDNKKGEEIVKDLLDYYVGLNHVRDSTELVEDTDTTYTHLEYEETPVWDIIKYIAESSDLGGVIGYDFRVAADGKFEFFPKNSKASPVSLSEKIEVSEYRKDIHRVRNKIMVYGLADKSVPADKDAWTESLTPTDGNWYEVSGTVSFDTVTKIKGTGSIKTYAANLYYAACRFVLNAGKEVNANLYPLLNFFMRRESGFNGNVNVILYDAADKSASHFFNVGSEEWFPMEFGVGALNADAWDVESGFDWTQIKIIRFDCWFTGSGTGSFWVDGLFFGGRRYSSTQEDATSQTNYGLRELVEVDEELYSDNDCDLRAKSLLDYLKDPAEYLQLRTTVLDYGNNPLLSGDKIHVTLPNENVDADFRIESVEYYVDAKSQTLEITFELGKVPPLLADYIYGLRATTVTVEKLARTKLGKRAIPTAGGGGGGGGFSGGNLIPAADDTYDIGEASKRWRDLYLAGAIKALAGGCAVHFLPNANATYDLGSGSKKWSNLFVAGVGDLGWLNVAGFTVITNTRILQNVLADAAIITSGKFPLARLPLGTSGYVLEAEGSSDPMYVDPNGRYQPAAHNHAAADITSGVFVEARIPHTWTSLLTLNGGLTMGGTLNMNASAITYVNGITFYGGSLNMNSCPITNVSTLGADTINVNTLNVTTTVNCKNWVHADILFDNEFRMTEAENVNLGHGLAFLNPKGKVIMLLDQDGNIEIFGKLKQQSSKLKNVWQKMKRNAKKLIKP